MTKITINRMDEFVNKYRDIKIFLDGENIGTVSNKEKKEFNLSKGSHTLLAKIDWCSSPKLTFTISENESKHFDLRSFAEGSRPDGFTALYYTFFKAGRFLKLSERSLH